MKYFQILLLLGPIELILAQINLTAYSKLPSIYTFDNYDYCLWQENSSKYCGVYAEIAENPDSELWLYIDELSNDTLHHYNHRMLYFGVCLDRCKDTYEILTPQERIEFSNNEPINDEAIDIMVNVTKRENEEDTDHYRNLINVCLNYKFQKIYNLTLRTRIGYCEDAKNVLEVDTMENIFYATIAAIIFFNILSSLYDYRLKQKQNDSPNKNTNDFYKIQNFENSADRFLTSFSICRNYYRLTLANSSESDFEFTYGIRVFTMLLVISVHVYMICGVANADNTHFVENNLYRWQIIMLQYGSVFVQMFFVLAGFLLKWKFTKKDVNKSEMQPNVSLGIYMQNFWQRYLRFLPSLALLVLFNATVLEHMQDGPYWRHLSSPERVNCRQYWWKNIFMINNFMIKDSCAHHTWYLAADIQLYGLYLIILIITSKFPELKRKIYIIVGVIAVAVPGILTYFYKLDACLFMKPETYRYLYFKNSDIFYITYTPFYCNLGGYLFGFIACDLYAKYIRNRELKIVEKIRGVFKFEILILATIFVWPVLMLSTGLLVFNGEPIWVAIFTAFFRNVWTLFCSAFLLCMLLKLGSIVYKFLCLPVFRPLGRLMFQTFLWHLPILRIINGYYRQPIYLNFSFLAFQVILTFVITIILAFIVTLAIESPFGEIVNFLMKHGTRQKTSDQIKNK